MSTSQTPDPAISLLAAIISELNEINVNSNVPVVSSKLFILAFTIDADWSLCSLNINISLGSQLGALAP